jgi:histone H3
MMVKSARSLKAVKISAKAASRKDAPASSSIKRPRRFRPGTRALMEIRKYQKSVDHLIPAKPFCRLVKDILSELSSGKDAPYRMQSKALEAVQEAAEAYMTGIFEDCNLVAIHARRVTVMSKDLALICRIRGLPVPSHVASDADANVEP